jgi:predicted SAM-dependent methyltransferase
MSGAKSYYTLESYVSILKGNVFIYRDLSYGIPVLDESVDFIYTSHFIEHLEKDTCNRLIKDIFRVLKPGGTIRIVVPDLAYTISLYSKGYKKEMLDNYFFINCNGSEYSRHRYMYDYDMLEEILNKNGYVNVVKAGYQSGKTPDIDILDNQPEVSIYVEAIKPIK